MKKFKVIVKGYPNLGKEFRSRMAALLYCEELLDKFGFYLYLKCEIHNI